MKRVLLGLFKIREHSLYPAYKNGDFVLISKIPILVRGFRPGDVVVFKHPQHGKMIKRVARIASGGRALWVLGSSSDSIDSRRFGWLPVEWVLGTVIWRIGESQG